MSLKTKVLIVAPHIDDELIGCWSVLKNDALDITVLYCCELTEVRMQEAATAAALLNFTPIFITPDLKSVMGWGLNLNSFAQVYVPSRRDSHADHQLVNRMYCQHATHYYSVDMGRGILLPDAEAKRTALNACYPSQRRLWDLNDKYWLFEDIRTQDYDEYEKVLVPDSEVMITVLKEHIMDVAKFLVTGSHKVSYGRPSPRFVATILGMCTGKVIIEGPGFYMEA